MHVPLLPQLVPAQQSSSLAHVSLQQFSCTHSPVQASKSTAQVDEQPRQLSGIQRPSALQVVPVQQSPSVTHESPQHGAGLHSMFVHSLGSSGTTMPASEGGLGDGDAVPVGCSGV